jgi:hypothetical protein
MAIECRHCGGTGTCTTGQDGVSCESCAGKAREGVFPFWPRKLSSLKGLPCGKCDGAGDLENRVWSFQSSIVPALGIVIIAAVLLICVAIAATSPAHHSQVLTLLGTLAGGVAGYYFRGQHIPPRPPTQRVPKNQQHLAGQRFSGPRSVQKQQVSETPLFPRFRILRESDAESNSVRENTVFSYSFRGLRA